MKKIFSNYKIEDIKVEGKNNPVPVEDTDKLMGNAYLLALSHNPTYAFVVADHDDNLHVCRAVDSENYDDVFYIMDINTKEKLVTITYKDLLYNAIVTHAYKKLTFKME